MNAAALLIALACVAGAMCSQHDRYTVVGNGEIRSFDSYGYDADEIVNRIGLGNGEIQTVRKFGDRKVRWELWGMDVTWFHTFYDNSRALCIIAIVIVVLIICLPCICCCVCCLNCAMCADMCARCRTRASVVRLSNNIVEAPRPPVHPTFVVPVHTYKPPRVY